MDVSDAELVEALRQRFGQQPLRSHIAQGRCRYQATYPDGECPWCAALETSSDAREAASGA